MDKLTKLSLDFFDYEMEVMENFREQDGVSDVSYWQGRKDAVRALTAMLLQEMGESERAELYRGLDESSPLSRGFEREIYQNMMADVVYNVAAVVWEWKEGRRVHPQTCVNLEQFVMRYDSMAKRGKFPVIDDHCLSR